MIYCFFREALTLALAPQQRALRTQSYLDVTMRVLGRNERDGMLGAQSEAGAGLETLVLPDDGLELDDAFDGGIFAVQSVDEQIYVAGVCGGPRVMRVGAKSFLIWEGGDGKKSLTRSRLRGDSPRTDPSAARHLSSWKATGGERTIQRRRRCTSLEWVPVKSLGLV